MSKNAAAPSFKGLNLELLKQEGQFAEYMIVAWGQVEGLVDIFVFDSYGITYADPRAKLLAQASFDKKLEHLKRTKYLTPEDCEKIEKLQHRRNDLFHYKDAKFAYLLMDAKEKAEAMREAQFALTACIRVIISKHPETADQFSPVGP